MSPHRISLRPFLASCALLCLALLGGGCGQDGPPRAAVKGTVNLDGEPLSQGSIRFIPTGETKGPEVGARIENGVFELSEEEGPVVGTVRVEIRDAVDHGYALDDPEEFVEKGNKPPPQRRIPPEYHRRSKITRTIKAGEVNELNFNIEIAGRKRRVRR